MDLGRVPGDHAGDAHYAMDATGRKWVSKRADAIGDNGLRAEATAWLLGEELHVRQPPSGIAMAGSVAEAWASGHLPVVRHWSASSANNLNDPSELGRVLMLDVLILNQDRNVGNLLLVPSPDLLHLNVYAIDHEQSEIGTPSAFADKAEALPDVARLARGLPIEVVHESALEAARKAGRLQTEALRRCVQEAADIVRQKDSRIVLDVLEYRCAHAPRLVSQYLELIRNTP